VLLFGFWKLFGVYGGLKNPVARWIFSGYFDGKHFVSKYKYFSKYSKVFY